MGLRSSNYQLDKVHEEVPLSSEPSLRSTTLSIPVAYVEDMKVNDVLVVAYSEFISNTAVLMPVFSYT